jgi:hypothetical protein
MMEIYSRRPNETIEDQKATTGHKKIEGDKRTRKETLKLDGDDGTLEGT